jgi:hypothetical protein
MVKKIKQDVLKNKADKILERMMVMHIDLKPNYKGDFIDRRKRQKDISFLRAYMGLL